MQIVAISGKARHGKDSTADIFMERIKEKGLKALRIYFGDFVKFIAGKYFSWDGEKDEVGRTLLQFIGTEKGRGADPDMWTMMVERVAFAFKDDFDYCLIPDARFKGEIEYFRKRDYDIVTVRVNRLNFDNGLTENQKKHISEVDLDNSDFDITIPSFSGLDNLRRVVMPVLDHSWHLRNLNLSPGD